MQQSGQLPAAPAAVSLAPSAIPDAPAWKGHLPVLDHILEALLSQDASSLEMCTTS